MEYFLIKPNGEQTGTYSIEQVRAMLAAGYIDQDTRYWHDGITGWQPIDRIEESLQFVPPPPPAPKTVAPQKLAAVLKAIPPPATKLEKPKAGEIQPRKVEGPAIPIPNRIAPDPIEEELPAREASTYAAPVVTQPPREPLSRFPRYVERLLCAALGALVMFAVLSGPAAVHYIANEFADKITLPDTNNFVLVDASTIKSFMQDLQTSPTVDSLNAQIAQTTDPSTLERLKISMAKESDRHSDEVCQQYLRSNIAQAIEAGTYRILAYYDDEGAPTTPRKGQDVWVAISYRDHTVYAFKPGDSDQTSP